MIKSNSFKYNLLILVIFQLSVLNIFAQDMSYDKDFLESLPDNVRADVEDELEDVSKREAVKSYKRPSSKLSKLDTVQKWERFLLSEENLNNDTQRYGLSIFRTMQTSFMPINEPNFDSNYIVDFGDSFNIKITGTKNKEYTSDVQRDGSIFIENVGSVSVSGLDISEAISSIKKKFNSVIIGEDIYVSLSEIRDIQVLITGESFAPGIYTLNGNTNILHALSMSGGVTETGSLRSIKVIRNGKRVIEFDAYNALLNGKINFNEKLQSGDSILISSVKNLVRISGGVKRSGLYELKENETLYDLLNFANGFSSSKSDDNMRYIFSSNANIDFMNISDNELKTITPTDGSGLYIPFHKKSYVEISGEVKSPGIYLISEVDTIKSIIKRSGGYTSNSYPYGGMLFNEVAKAIEKNNAQKAYDYFIKSLTTMAMSARGEDSNTSIVGISSLLSEYMDSDYLGRIQANFDMLDIQNNPNIDTSLSDGDKIVIPRLTDQVYVFGEVAEEGAKRFNDDLGYKDYIINNSGGYTNFADKSSIYIIAPDGSTQLIGSTRFNPLGILDSDLDIYPGSIIYVAPKTVSNLQNVSLLAPIVSSLVLSVASLQSISN